jgi:hypothetical protein
MSDDRFINRSMSVVPTQAKDLEEGDYVLWGTTIQQVKGVLLRGPAENREYTNPDYLRARIELKGKPLQQATFHDLAQTELVGVLVE